MRASLGAEYRIPNSFDRGSSNLSPSCCSALDVILIVETCIAFLINFALFSNVVRSKKLRQQYSVKFFFNLQFAHMLLSISAFATIAEKDKILRIYISSALLIATFLALLVSTMDRFIAIQYPYKYVQLDKRCFAGALMITWIPAISFLPISILLKIDSDGLMIISCCLIAVAAFVL